jgi:hypothetical protein
LTAWRGRRRWQNQAGHFRSIGKNPLPKIWGLAGGGKIITEIPTFIYFFMPQAIFFLI